MSTKKPIILAAHFPGVNNHTVWSDPQAGSQIGFASFKRFAQAAERGLMDFVFLAEGLRLREQRGRLHELDVVGRPNTLAVLAALSGVTEYIGLAGTLNATFNEPYNLARQLASLDHLSGGRSAWNVVTSPGAFTGENFRRGAYLPHAQRYERAREFVAITESLWSAWKQDKPGEFEHRSPQFSLRGRVNLPRLPQGKPVIIQAGDSDEGREFAAHSADAIFTRHGSLAQGKAFYTDVKSRLADYGRGWDDLKILPGVGFVIGDTAEDAAQQHAQIRRQQVSPQTAIVLLEQLWNRDLSHLDPDGPLPEEDPDFSDQIVARGRTRQHDDRLKTANEWRALAKRDGLSIRELVIKVTDRQQFVGTPETIADTIEHFVDEQAADGFILVPHIVPSGIESFVERVIPLLQERGRFRRAYEGRTLRDHLGLPASAPEQPAASTEASTSFA